MVKNTKAVTMKKLTISYRPISEVAVNARNARTHDKRQLKQIKVSIEAFGFINPLLVAHQLEFAACGEARKNQLLLLHFG